MTIIDSTSSGSVHPYTAPTTTECAYTTQNPLTLAKTESKILKIGLVALVAALFFSDFPRMIRGFTKTL